jgi:hypothetical protein
MAKTKSGPRNIPQDVELSKEFLYTNYREVIARMYENGICGKDNALAMLDRVEAIVGEDSE